MCASSRARSVSQQHAMPRPASQRVRAKGLPQLLAACPQLVNAVHGASLSTSANALEQPHVQQALFSYFQAVQETHMGKAPTEEQSADAVTKFTEQGLLSSLLSLLRCMTPATLMGSAGGCADPSCDDGSCGPEPGPVLLLSTNMTMSLVLGCSDAEIVDKAYASMIQSQLVSRFLELGDLR